MERDIAEGHTENAEFLMQLEKEKRNCNSFPNK